MTVHDMHALPYAVCITIVHLCMASACLHGSMTLGGLRRKPPTEEEEVLKQALLGADIEAPAAKEKRPW